MGGYYGARLCRAGHEVHFLLRSDYDVLRERGVEVRSYQGDFRARPRCARLPHEIGPADCVVIGLKTTANAEFPRLLPPLVGPATRVVTLQNGLGNEEALARLFPPTQILGGLCFVCLNRLAPGVIVHTDHGRIALGEYAPGVGAEVAGGSLCAAGERARSLSDTFRAAGIECQVTADLRRAHWEKLVWNVPFNGLGVAGVAGYEAVAHGEVAPGNARGAVLPTDRLCGDARWRALVRELMLEVIRAARAMGMELPETLADEQIARTATMGAYKASTLIDFERGLPLEVDSLFLEPLRQARQAGVETPRLAALCRVLAALNPRQAAPPLAMRAA